MNITNLDRIKLLLGITDSSLDATLDIWASGCEADYMEIRGSGFPVDDDGDDIVPETAEFVIAEMVGYKLEKRKSLGLSSERLADYSKTMDTTSAGYPSSIVGRIKKYLRIK